MGSLKNTVAINGTTGLLLIGGNLDGPTPTYCAADNVSASINLDSNLGQVEIDGNTVSGSVNLTNTAAGLLAPQIEGNTIKSNLSCCGNSPAPTADGYPNTVSGTKSGQCNVAGM